MTAVKRPRKTKSPLGVAPLENFGFIEGRVRSIYPRENKREAPQAQCVLEQRLPSTDGKVRYNQVLLTAFDAVATTMLQLVKPEHHIRVRYRLTSWKPPGRPPFMSAIVEMFRIYRSTETNESWIETDPIFDPPPSECYQYDPAEDGA